LARFKQSIPVSFLKADMMLADAVIKEDGAGSGLIFARVNTRVDEELIERLYRHNVKNVTIYSNPYQAEKPPSQKTIRQIVPAYQPKANQILDDKLREEAVSNIHSIFDAAKDGMKEGGDLTSAFQVVQKLDDLVLQLVDTLLISRKEFIHINDIKSYDEYTYHHSLSVAILSVSIGQTMGLGLHDLQQLCRSSLLHDIGKIWVPSELITKPGRLDLDEYEVVKGHTKHGGQYLKNGVFGDLSLLLGVMFHHERYDGTGYPRQLRRKDIPLFARIIAVADVYDALTSNRPYRKPMVPADALELIQFDSGKAFDPEIVQALKEKLDLYPIDTIVELSNRRKGIVVDNFNNKRPLLKMADNGELLDLNSISNLNLVITRLH